MTKEEVTTYLIKLFPNFLKVWNSGDTLYRDEDGSYTYHGLFLEFSHYFRENFKSFSDKQLKDLFTQIEKWERKEDENYKKDDAQSLSNAVFTCFLEYIAGEGFTERLKPFMGKKSLEYYSHYDYEPMDKKVYEEQQEICEIYKADYTPVAMDSMIGVSENTDGKTVPINGLRHPQQGHRSGWFIWSGEELSQNDNFFKPHHVKHIEDICPQVLKFLALPPGYRFLIDNDGYIDVWYDPELLNI